MASPQKENGYTAIANEIMDKMARTKLSPTQYRILFTVWRNTYGYQRKAHRMSLTYIANGTGCDKRSIQRELKKMIEMKILSESYESQTRILGFNKHLKQWETIGETANGNIDNGETTNGETAYGAIGETATSTDGETANQQRKTKERLKERISKKPKIDLQQYDLSQSVVDVLAEFVEHRKQMKKPATQLAVKKIINMFQQNKYNDDEMIFALEKSIMNGYQGVFPLKDNERIYKEVEKPKEPEPQFESEEQRQAQKDFVASLLRSQPPAIDLERMLE